MDYNWNDVYLADKNSPSRFIRKERHNIFRRISDVKLSHLANEIDNDLAAINLFGLRQTIFSEDVCEQGDKVFHDTLLYNSGPRIFQNIDLDKTLRCRPYENLVEQWLLATALGIGDMSNGNNTMILKKPDGRLSISRAYDLEISMFLATPQTTPRINPQIFEQYFPFLETGMPNKSVKSLHRHPAARETATKFFDNLRSVGPKLSSILDFSKLKHTLGTECVDVDLAGLSEQAVKGYSKRFDMLANQFAIM